MHILSAVAIGVAAGFGYHKIVGCRTGTCPITANPWTSMVYGGVMGFMFGGGMQ